MPTSSGRPWSTQYRDDYNSRSAGLRKARRPATAKPKSNRSVHFKTGYQIPATHITIPETRVYSGEHFGLDDPYGVDDMIGLPCTSEDTPFYKTEPVIPEPTDIDTEPPKPELHWICWPEHKTTKRLNTSQGLQTETCTFDKNATSIAELPPAGVPLTFEPKINSWTNAETDAERQAVDMYTTLKRSQSFYEPTPARMTSISVNNPPARDTYTLYGNRKPSYAINPAGLYQQGHFPYHQAGGAGPREDMVIQGLSKQYTGRQPVSQSYDFSFNKYPLHMRNRKRFPASTADYIHDQSLFMTTSPRCVGYFIIHPDWVSERSALRRSNTMVLPDRKRSQDGLRY